MKPLNLKPYVPPDEYLEALELFLELNSLPLVARQLGINSRTVQLYLIDMGIALKYVGRSLKLSQDPDQSKHIESVRARLTELVKTSVTPPRSRADLMVKKLLRSLDLYLELKDLVAVGRVLGTNPQTIERRLWQMGVKTRPHSAQPTDLNAPAFLAEIKRRLEAGEDVRRPLRPR